MPSGAQQMCAEGQPDKNFWKKGRGKGRFDWQKGEKKFFPFLPGIQLTEGAFFMAFFRGRRLRGSEGLRAMVRETVVLPQDLIMPYFVIEDGDASCRLPVDSMPGIFQFGLDALEEQVGRAVERGLRSCLLFGIPAVKDARGSGAWAPDGIVQRAVVRLREHFPGLVIITDTCLCEFTDHGHCGMVSPGDVTGNVDNDSSVELLAQTALSQARAGADIVAPSDMMDGRVAAIRRVLDEQGYSGVPVMSYAVKYASGFYGPFREAAKSTPQFGDRRTYQMDPGNAREAVREAEADIAEGADMLIVKPGLPYLDIVRDISRQFPVPVLAYQVSGEYAMIKAAGAHGWIDEQLVIKESLLCLKRAGAQMIITYFTEALLGEL